MTSGGGVVIELVDNSAHILALTMATFVIRLLGQLNGQADLPPGPRKVRFTKRTYCSSVFFVLSAMQFSAVNIFWLNFCAKLQRICF